MITKMTLQKIDSVNADKDSVNNSVVLYDYVKDNDENITVIVDKILPHCRKCICMHIQKARILRTSDRNQ